MKTILTLLFLCLSTILFSQIKGVNFSNAVINTNPELTSVTFPYETLVLFEENFYVKTFANTVKGYNHAVNYAYNIVIQNGLDFYNPNYRDEVTYDSYIKGPFDYNSVDISLLVGNTEIIKVWEINGYYIIFACNSQNRYVAFEKLNK